MPTKLILKCDGCSSSVEVGGVRREFRSFSGRTRGFGTRVQPDIDALVSPTGWVWSDPYTNCTYCPECWAQIESHEAAE